MKRSVIVEDEQLASQYLLSLIEQHPNDFQNIGVADSGKSAIALINKLKPDLIFLDIHLPDMTGFDVLGKLEYQPMVIFTTAYERYAIQSFETFCVDYLVKPITEDRFHLSIEKLNRIQQPRNIDLDLLTKALEDLKQKKSISAIPITLGDRIILIECEDITHLKGEDKYVRVYSEKGKSHLSSRTLNLLESTLPDNFIRVHRSAIVNRDHITDIRKYFKGKLLLTVGDEEGSTITTGGQYTESVKAALGIK